MLLQNILEFVMNSDQPSISVKGMTEKTVRVKPSVYPEFWALLKAPLKLYLAIAFDASTTVDEARTARLSEIAVPSARTIMWVKVGLLRAAVWKEVKRPGEAHPYVQCKGIDEVLQVMKQCKAVAAELMKGETGPRFHPQPVDFVSDFHHVMGAGKPKDHFGWNFQVPAGLMCMGYHLRNLDSAAVRKVRTPCRPP